MMQKVWLRRVNALTLAVMLAGGGSGLPIFDALFHHIGRTRMVTHACVERGDTQSLHAERCSLGAALPALARSAAGPTAARIGPDPVTRYERPPDLQVPPAVVATPSLPRGPPVSIA
jgi:hypothetical protein